MIDAIPIPVPINTAIAELALCFITSVSEDGIYLKYMEQKDLKK